MADLMADLVEDLVEDLVKPIARGDRWKANIEAGREIKVLVED
jgi:hypothetical protein